MSSASYTKRILKELKDFEKEKYTTMFIKPKDDKLNKLMCLFIAPEGSPFEGGFFYFQMLIPDQYPFVPPIVKFLTPTGTQRLHPNLYAEGKVCLSILGTWSGDEKWSSLLTIEKVMLTISGLLDNNPLSYEPPYRKSIDVNYTTMSRYLTLLTVMEMRNRDTEFKNEINNYFYSNIGIYQKSLEKLLPYDKTQIKTMHNDVTINLSKIKIPTK